MKLTKHAWIIWSIALAAVIALMILIPFSRTAVWWIAAGCTVLMFVLCAFTFLRAFRKDETPGWAIRRYSYRLLSA